MNLLFESSYKDVLYYAYWVEQKSTYVIAKEFGCTHNLVLRALKHHGIKVRTKKEAQKLALKLERMAHPTKGKKHSDISKNKISNQLVLFWEQMSQEERQFRRELGVARWDRMGEYEKKQIQELAMDAIKNVDNIGSKLELFLYNHLTSNNYKVLMKEKVFIEKEYIKCDLIVVNLNTIIYVDGVSMFFPVWGTDKLKETIGRAEYHDGILLRNGYNIVRIKNIFKQYTRKTAMRVVSKLFKILNKLAKETGKREFLDIRGENGR